jgi:hypothetical protein
VGDFARIAATETAMKMLQEYLDNAANFDRMAKEESDPALKAQFEKQAAAYRKLAKERAKQYGMPTPSPPEQKSG